MTPNKKALALEACPRSDHQHKALDEAGDTCRDCLPIERALTEWERVVRESIETVGCEICDESCQCWSAEGWKRGEPDRHDWWVCGRCYTARIESARKPAEKDTPRRSKYKLPMTDKQAQALLLLYVWDHSNHYDRVLMLKRGLPSLAIFHAQQDAQHLINETRQSLIKTGSITRATVDRARATN